MLYSIMYCGNIPIVGNYALVVEGTVTSVAKTLPASQTRLLKCWTGNWVLWKLAATMLQSSMRYNLKVSSLTYKELEYV